MHEFSICQFLIKALDDEYDAIDPAPSGLASVKVTVGGMHQIVPDFLTGAYSALTADTRFEGSELKLNFTTVRGRCPACDWQGAIDPPLFVCPECSQTGVELTSGKELFIETLEVRTC
jgi:hydrogenase nickel incorporation protein HypA/HybF